MPSGGRVGVNTESWVDEAGGHRFQSEVAHESTFCVLLLCGSFTPMAKIIAPIRPRTMEIWKGSCGLNVAQIYPPINDEGAPAIPVNVLIVPITVARLSTGIISAIKAFQAGPPAKPIAPPPRAPPMLLIHLTR